MADGRRVLSGSIVVVLLAAMAWWWLAMPAPEDNAPEHVLASAPTPDASTRPAPATRPATPLPPAGAPLPAIASELASRADAGDSRAACRLAIELLRCEALEAEARRQPGDPGLPSHEDDFVAAGDLESANRVAELYLWRKERLAECRALPPALHDQRWDRLRAAALAGEAEAMRRYIDAHALLGAGHEMIRDPRFDAWRREAPRMLEQLFHQGDGWALMRLWIGSMNDDTPLTGLVPDDPARARAYERLIHDLAGRRTGAPVRTGPVPSSAEELAVAPRQAQSWRQRYFAGRRLDPSRWALDPLTVGPSGDEPGCD